MTLAATCSETETVAEERHYVILETVGNFAGVSTRVHLKAVRYSVFVENFVKLDGVEP